MKHTHTHTLKSKREQKKGKWKRERETTTMEKAQCAWLTYPIFRYFHILFHMRWRFRRKFQFQCLSPSHLFMAERTGSRSLIRLYILHFGSHSFASVHRPHALKENSNKIIQHISHSHRKRYFLISIYLYIFFFGFLHSSFWTIHSSYFSTNFTFPFFSARAQLLMSILHFLCFDTNWNGIGWRLCICKDAYYYFVLKERSVLEFRFGDDAVVVVVVLLLMDKRQLRTFKLLFHKCLHNRNSITKQAQFQLAFGCG